MKDNGRMEMRQGIRSDRSERFELGGELERFLIVRIEGHDEPRDGARTQLGSALTVQPHGLTECAEGIGRPSRTHEHVPEERPTSGIARKRHELAKSHRRLAMVPFVGEAPGAPKQNIALIKIGCVR